MNRYWKDFRTNFMYWRFRHITRNRLRLKTWYSRRRAPAAPSRPRGSASNVYRRSSHRPWIALLVMVVLLTVIGVLPRYVALSSSLTFGLSALVVVGAIYWALRGV